VWRFSGTSGGFVSAGNFEGGAICTIGSFPTTAI
jgi:hypothetical protein